MAWWIAIAVGLLLGYALGRTRPLWSARDWARWNLMGFGPQSTFRALVALALLPDDWRRIWTRRNAPPPSLAEAPKLNPKWQSGDDT